MKAARMIQKIINYVKGISGEAMRYIIAGVTTTLVNFALFALMTEILHLPVTPSNVTSIAVSILYAYVVNKRFVFKNKCDTAAELALEFVKFVGARLFTMAIEILGVLLTVNILGQNKMLGKAETQVLVIVANYFISKLLVFRKRGAD